MSSMIDDDSPGFTFCVESCGCAACGCFFCTSGCLFYRTYAVPTSDTVYEVFNCPVWKYAIQEQILVILNLQAGKISAVSKHDIELQPGREIKWRNFRIDLIGISNPPAPLLAHTFLRSHGICFCTLKS